VVDRDKFDVKGFYSAMAECKSLLIRREDVRWSEQFQAPDRPVDAMLAFGCAVQHTPHLMLEATRVFEALGIDYAAVTGRQFCCGRPFLRMGKDEVAADKISAKSYERFVAHQPQALVQWCGACMLQYLEVISQQTDPPFEVIHVTKYLARLLRELGDDVPWKQEVRARVVLHTHGEFVPQQDVDTAAILEILDMIPGVEFAGPVTPPSAGSPCDLTGPTAVSVLNTLSTAGYREAQGELEDQLAAVGADTLVTPYHKCQMEWSKFSSRSMAVREWMSLLAEALGVAVEDRYTTYWHIGHPPTIVERSRTEWESWGLTEEEALEAARRNFVPEYAVDVHHCDCGGTGCGAGVAEAALAELAERWPQLAQHLPAS
jgi:Fe-S oxidoreductase